jgi:type I restriction enzyme S subunit
MTHSKSKIQNPKLSLPRYDRYKDSGIEWLGDVPEHWEVEKGLRYLFETEDRSVKGDEELLSVSHLTGVTPRSEKNITMFMAESYEGSKLCDVGDIAINTMWAWMSALGVSKYRGLVSPSYGTYRQRKPERFNPTFLDHLIRTDVYRSHYTVNSTGITTSRLRLYPHSFLRLKFICPPREEQDRIVAFLDRKTAEIDALIAKKQRRIELLDEQKAILINRAVTRGLNPNAKLKSSGIEWIGEIPEGWEVKKIKHCGYLKGGAGFPPHEQGRADNELLFYKVGSLGSSKDGRLMADPDSSITRKTAKRLGAHVFPPRAIVYAKIGAALLLNRRRMTTADCCLDNNMTGYVVTSSELLPEWAHRFLSLIDFGTLVNPGPVPSLAEGRQSDLPIVLPPLPVQVEILEVLQLREKSIGDVAAKVSSQIESLKNLRSTLIAHAVTGRIKV